MVIKLNNNLSFSIERYDRHARLLIHKDGAELVCRKSTFSELSKIIETDNTHLFKGRLQLYRSGDNISVEVKGKPEGVISLNEFDQSLQAAELS